MNHGLGLKQNPRSGLQEFLAPALAGPAFRDARARASRQLYALNRATRLRDIGVATSSDAEYLYIWKTEAKP